MNQVKFANFSHQETNLPTAKGEVVAMRAFADSLKERRNSTNTIKTWSAKVDDLLSDAYDEYYYQQDWNGYSSKPLEKQSVRFAKQFLKALPNNIQMPQIDPSPTGLLGLYWKKSGYQLLLDINIDGVISYAFRADTGLAYTGRPSFFTSVPSALKNLLGQYFQAD